MKKILTISITSLVFIWGLFNAHLYAHAGIFDVFTEGVSGQSASDESQSNCRPNSQGQEICYLENPIGVGQTGTTEVSELINTIIRSALGIIGALTLVMFVWGGFQWLTSAGNPEKVEAGTQTMVWAVIGVVLVLASYVLLSTFLGFLT